MDFGPRASATMLAGMSGLTTFHGLDDDVAKEQTHLSVEPGFGAGEAFLGAPGSVDLRTVGALHATTVTLSDGSEPQEPVKRKGGWTKGKKRTKVRVKDVNAPKMPLSGYLRYLTERREKLRSENPSLSFTEISKQLGAEWSGLPQHEKQRYLDEAEKDKERYNREMEAYQQTDAYRAFHRQANTGRKEQEVEPRQQIATPNLETLNVEDEEPGTFDVSIFTEEFLDHNKARDSELRQLRKQTTELEEQNAILSKHMDNMRQAVERLETETQQMQVSNTALGDHYSALKVLLTQRFSSLPLPGTKEPPNLETIESYMSRLHTLVLAPPTPQHQAFLTTALEIIGRLGNIEEKL